MISIESKGANKWGIAGVLAIQTADASNELLVEAIDLKAESECDLEDVSHMDSAGLAVLIEVQKQVHLAGGTVCFSNVPTQISDLINVAAVGQFLRIV